MHIKKAFLKRFVGNIGDGSVFLSFDYQAFVNGNKEVINRPIPEKLIKPLVPPPDSLIEKNDYVALLKNQGPSKFAQWVKKQEQLFITDTTMRDAHQSLFATRVRTKDIISIAKTYSQMIPNLFSVECWGIL